VRHTTKEEEGEGEGRVTIGAITPYGIQRSQAKKRKAWGSKGDARARAYPERSTEGEKRSLGERGAEFGRQAQEAIRFSFN